MPTPVATTYVPVSHQEAYRPSPLQEASDSLKDFISESDLPLETRGMPTAMEVLLLEGPRIVHDPNPQERINEGLRGLLGSLHIDAFVREYAQNGKGEVSQRRMQNLRKAFDLLSRVSEAETVASEYLERLNGSERNHP